MPLPPEAVLGVVPVPQDDPSAPGGSAALRTLGGVPLVRRAVGALLRSGRVGRVVVPVEPALRRGVAAALDGLAGSVRVHAAPPAGALLLAALDDASEAVVAHDPLHPLAAPALVGAVLDALEDPHCDAAVPVRPVTDTLVRVSADGDLLGHADREAHRLVLTPQAYRPEALRLGPPRVLLEALPAAVRDAGARLRAVPVAAEVLRVATPEDLVVAEAVLAVDGPAS